MSHGWMLLVVAVTLVGCASRDTALDGDETETGETETGEDESPAAPIGDGCSVEVLWQAPPRPASGVVEKSWMFAGARSGGFFIAATQPEREQYVLSRYDAAGEVAWAVEAFFVDLEQDGGDLLELGDGRIVLVSPDYHSGGVGWGGAIGLYEATGEVVWSLPSDGTPWEVVGPQGSDGFACAGALAWAWSDINGMSTGRYFGQDVGVDTAWQPDTSRRLAALHGDDGRTWVVDWGCGVDELDTQTGLPVSWGVCVGDEANTARFSSLDRLAGGTLIAGGALVADDGYSRPTARAFGPDGDALASWTGAEEAEVHDLAALSDGGALLGGTRGLWRIDAQLELVGACRLTLADAPWAGVVRRVAVDEQGRVLAELRATAPDGFAGVVRIEGLVE